MRRSPPSTSDVEAVASRRLEDEVRTALRGSGPIVAGPWRGEVGYEVLYWIPFLRFLCRRFDLDRSEVVAVSRGGAGAWYSDLAGRYVDVFELMSVEAFRRAVEAEWTRAGGQKQGVLSGFDRTLLGAVERRIGSFRLLHPSLLFKLFERVWKGGASLGHVFAHTEYVRSEAPVHELGAALPDRFVAAKFYFRDSFPDNVANRVLVGEALRRLAADRPVVLLETGLEVDDHADLEARGIGLLRPLAGVAPVQNLEAQSAVVGRAEAFVGTYGGFSYLAPTYGVRSIALASAAHGLFPVHLDVGRRAAARCGASLSFLDVSSIDRLRAAAQA